MTPFGFARHSRSALVHQERSLVGIAFALSITGCASTRGTSVASVTADSELASPRQTASERELAASVTGPELDRAAYVRAVLARNPSVEAARQGFRAALARVRQAGVFEDPMVDVGIAPLSIGSKAPLGYELGISQKLPWFGKRSLETAAFDAEAAASKSDYQVVQRELALSAVVLYDRYFVAERSLEINAHHVELLRAMRAGATAQFAAGRGSAQDPLQAEAELAHMEHDAAVLASQRDVTVAQMNELLHRAPELPLPPPPHVLPKPASRGALDAGGAQRLQAEAIARRSEISAARERARAEGSRAERASRDGYPDFTLSTSYNSMWDMPEHRWMVGLGFNLPIQGGRRAGAEDEALAARAQFESEAARMTDAVRTQVFVANKQVEESEHVMSLMQERLLPIARQQVDAARAGFITSQNSFVAVIDAEKNLRGVELEYELAQAECDRHRAELERALGRIPGLDNQEQDR
ncbi:MAG TPA: TolC family protein [Polyangiaceae bacterium]|jgi:outer membrane protein TolC